MKYYAPILVGLALSIGGGVLVAGAQGYVPLAPLPGTITEGSNSTDLTTYLTGMIKLLVALGGALAVVMLIIGGTQYVAAGINPSAKSDAKEHIWNALIGLTLVLTSYLILNSIDPRLVQFNLSLPKVGVMPTVSSSITASPTTPSPTGTTGCASCVTMSSIIPQKAPGQGCALPGPCTVSPIIEGKLEALAKGLSAQGVNWQVSESWPPTRTHRADCQNSGPEAGTCVDASLLSARTPTNIDTFASTASTNGMRAVYEVPTEARRQELISNGTTANVIVVPGITGEHFSVYNK